MSDQPPQHDPLGPHAARPARCRRVPGRPGYPVELHELPTEQPGLLPFEIGTFAGLGPHSHSARPHRHTFHEIVLVTAGAGTHVVDLERHPLAPPQLYAITPGQVHHWEDEGLAGWVLVFNEEFLHPHPEDAEALRALSGRPGLRLDGPAAARFEALFDAMAEEYRLAEPGFAGVLAGFLHILVLRALRLCAAVGEGRGGAADRAGDLAARFSRLISPPGSRDRSVGALARELGVSPGHLHEAVKRTTGRTPGRLVRDQQTLEAKRLLLGSDLTIRQISERVGFGDPSYFCRFFRRESGVSPGAFRKAAREQPVRP